jgi:hypothetical protein
MLETHIGMGKHGKTWGLSMIIVYIKPQNRRGCGLALQGVIPRTCGFEPMARPQVPPERKQTATFFLLSRFHVSGFDIVFTSFPKPFSFAVLYALYFSILFRFAWQLIYCRPI